MKKITALFLIFIMAFQCLACFAKSGDIAGNYYSTDIKTFLNGAQIDAINIGGQTLISAEDMQYHSFFVYWSNEERTLEIHETELASNGVPPEVKNSTLPSGSVLGNYYETDIITYLDKEPITAYNIGGRTYIHAEAMRDFGYVVNWYADERKLEITSPMRAGYVYDIRLSQGKKKEAEGIGSFTIKYTKDGIIGYGDADYFNLTMDSSGQGYYFTMAFHQNRGLFTSTLLQDKLRPLAHEGYGVETPCEPSQKYDLVNKTVAISINGNKSEKVRVISGAGSGHRDFTFAIQDLPTYTEEEINEIVFSVGETTGEPCDIIIEKGEEEKFLEKLSGHMVTYFQGENHFIFYMREELSLGNVVSRLYIADRTTGEISDDILKQVKEFEGFDYDFINPFAFSIGAVPNNFLFSCSSPEKTMDFYAELDTGKVYKR